MKMNFFDEISKKYKIFVYGDVSSIDSIKKLKDFSTIQIPEEYFEIISEKREIEINIKDRKYISIWSRSVSSFEQIKLIKLMVIPIACITNNTR